MRALGILAGSMVLLAACGNQTAGPSAVAGEAPTTAQWRTELWRGISVDVPPDWAYGGAPLTVGGGTVACPAQAMVSASGGRVRGDEPATPYVGRPFVLTDLCESDPVTGPDAVPPSAPSVWLGTDLPAGSEDLGGGWVRETVRAAGTTVTVTSDDPDLRDRILASVGRVQRCAPVLPEPTRVKAMLIEGYGRPESLEVCAYRRSEAGDLELAYGTVLGADAARAFERAIDEADRRRMDCGGEPPAEWVTLEMTGVPYTDPPVGVGGTQDMVIGCGVVETGPGQTYEVDEHVLDSLRVKGLPAVMPSLIGPLG